MKLKKQVHNDDKRNDLSVLELEQLLTLEEKDSELILRVLKQIRQYGNDNTADIERAWEEFQQLYNTPDGRGRSLYSSGLPKKAEKTKRQPLRIFAAVAACLAICLISVDWMSDLPERLGLDRCMTETIREECDQNRNEDWSSFQEALVEDRMLRAASQQ